MDTPEPKKADGLDTDKILHLIGPDGFLSHSLKGFEPRDQQRKMMHNIIDAYNNDEIALIEAGTGTGKSMAYLIPAMMWALRNKEKTVISTNTITLQEQLIHKDIPMLTQALQLDIKAVLVKGMSNYLCLRKLEDAKHELPGLPIEEAAELEQIERWSASTKEGSRSTLPMVPSSNNWERVCAENDTCSHQQCPYFNKCFFFKARREAEDAQILVANHHLLFADLSIRAETNNYEETSILPMYTRVIMDEAHHIEDVATDFFGNSVSKLGILRLLSRLSSEKQNKLQGKLAVLREKLDSIFGVNPPNDVASLVMRLNIDLPGTRRELQELTTNTFQALAEFIESTQAPSNTLEQGDAPAPESKLRLLPVHHTHPIWESRIVPAGKKLVECLKRYMQALASLEADLKEIDNDRLQEQTKGIRLDIGALAMRLANHTVLVERFLMEPPSNDKVRWIEEQQLRIMRNVSLSDAELDISNAMVNCLFSKFPTIILCSATLATNQQFNFVCRRLGITEEKLPGRPITEHIYDSPFDYATQAMLAIPTDVPYPQHPEFTQSAAEQIWQAVEVSRGSAFVLFTSYGMMKSCHEILYKKFTENRYHIFKQGDDNRQALLTKFKNTERSILFGTDSFWEGVDVVGEALRCVIIVKLPFKVPTEPIIQARTEAIIAAGGDPFFEYTLPNAIVKFKQGFGRLIRNKRDRGCIVCLDTRLITKGYGKQFLNSLPVCQQVFASSEHVEQHMREFYRKTHHLVLNRPK